MPGGDVPGIRVPSGYQTSVGFRSQIWEWIKEMSHYSGSATLKALLTRVQSEILIFGGCHATAAEMNLHYDRLQKHSLAVLLLWSILLITLNASSLVLGTNYR